MSTLAEKIKKIPKKPGVYFFVGNRGQILYIGKALSLKDRVRSYFAKDLVESRSRLIEDMVQKAKDIKFEVTDSALEALILEAALIRKHKPKYNTREKDNKSFNYLVITKEEFPRVLLVRGKELKSPAMKAYAFIAGPFPQGKLLQEALKITRKIFPFRDKCELNSKKPCFNYQIGLCPGVCIGEISKENYQKDIKNIELLFSGKKRSLIKNLEKEMNILAKKQEFEEAKNIRNKISALKHIQDISLIGKEYNRNYLENQSSENFKIESYDVAHIMGTNVVGAMISMLGEQFDKNSYRKFKIKINPGIDDTGALKEILERRLKHIEWQLPNLIVVDGGKAQKRTAESILADQKLSIPVVAVTKDEKHKAKALIGKKEIIEKHQENILKSNLEVHRFVLNYHRQIREKIK